MAETTYAGNSTIEEVKSFTLGSDVDSDTVDLVDSALGAPAKGFHANAAGTLKISDLAGNAVALVVLAGCYYPYGVSRLWATGHTTITTADVFLAR